jgi:type VI secretion system protein VasJ
MSSLNAEIVALGSTPISANAPAGESLRYDPEFERLNAEIAKTESLTATVVDWDSVVQLSTTSLRSKSKDYRVAGYLVFGLFQTKGYPGLLSGLRMYEALIRNYWENAFPEKTRMRGRLGAVEWLYNRLTAALARHERRPVPEDTVLDLEKATQDFVSAVSEFFGDQAPAFKELISDANGRANDLRSRLANAEKAKDEQARRDDAIASGQVIDSSCAEKVTEECREKLWRVAAFYFGADPSDPLAYRIRRSTTWGWLVSVPVHNNGATHLAAPPPNALLRCEALSANGEWQSLVDEVESNFIERMFAFDLQRHCVHALGQMGENYSAARQAIITELAGLIRRLPEILDLRFSDSTPFADSTTRSWIDAEVLPVAPDNQAPGKNDYRGAGEGGRELESAALEARRLVEGGRLQEAVALFKEGIAKASQRRLRFLWRLQLARLCMESGKPQLALSQLLSLDEDVTRFALEEWEPELSLEVVHQLFLCRQKLAASMQETRPDAERQLQELYQRLCRLDVNTALAVES